MASEVPFSRIQGQLEDAGFQLVRVKGSHHVFERPGSQIVIIPVHKNKVKPVYARKVKKIIEADEEAEESSDE